MKTHIASALLITAFAIVTPARAVDIVAHRGASYDAPENTLASEKLAWEQGADVVETDIYLTSDGKIIVAHDKSAKRTSGKDVVFSKSTFDEIRTLDAGSWKDPKYAGEKHPSLEEQLKLMPKGKRMFVEIKSGPEIVPELARCLKKCGAGKHNITIISFNYDSLKAVRKKIPELATQFLMGYKKPEDRKPGAKPPPSIEELIATAKAAKFTGLDLQDTWPLTAADVKKIKDAGLELHIWTVDDPAIAKHWIGLGALSITTNRPGYMREQLGL